VTRATAEANANIALVKYWGKRDTTLNLPSAGSISLTLSGLKTRTTVSFGESDSDQLTLDGGRVTGPGLNKALKVVDRVRALAQLDAPVRIESSNDFPTAAGLASSSSGFAALSAAAAAAAGLDLSPPELSVLARLGSGSASRSIYGGFAEWRRGERDDGSDSHALQLFSEDHWPLTVVIALIDGTAKAVSSSAGMMHTSATSPFHDAFIRRTAADLDSARAAIGARDFEALTQVAEGSALRMHADMMAAEPALIYMQPATLAVIKRVHELRAQGAGAFFTVDAGPNVKVFCAPDDAAAVEQELRAMALVSDTLRAGPGAGVRLVSA
jgi:diphosphomevalonate decarboxylase